MKEKYIKPMTSPIYVEELMQAMGGGGTDEADSPSAKKINWSEDWEEDKDESSPKTFGGGVYPVNPKPWDER